MDSHLQLVSVDPREAEVRVSERRHVGEVVVHRASRSGKVGSKVDSKAHGAQDLRAVFEDAVRHIPNSTMDSVRRPSLRVSTRAVGLHVRWMSCLSLQEGLAAGQKMTAQRKQMSCPVLRDFRKG